MFVTSVQHASYIQSLSRYRSSSQVMGLRPSAGLSLASAGVTKDGDFVTMNMNRP